MNRTSRLLRPLSVAFVLTTLAAVVLQVARRFDPAPEGLRIEYFANTDWASPSIRSTFGRPSTETLRESFDSSHPDNFSATFQGSLIVRRSGTYTFATESDDGSFVYVDGQPVVNNGGLHGMQRAEGSVQLDAGVHDLFIRYVQSGGDFGLEFLWGRDGAALSLVPDWTLRHGRSGSL